MGAHVRDLLSWTKEDIPVPVVTAEQTREADRIAVVEFGLGVLQMMENAGRNLAANTMEMFGIGHHTSLLRVYECTGCTGSVQSVAGNLKSRCRTYPTIARPA